MRRSVPAAQSPQAGTVASGRPATLEMTATDAEYERQCAAHPEEET